MAPVACGWGQRESQGKLKGGNDTGSPTSGQKSAVPRRIPCDSNRNVVVGTTPQRVMLGCVSHSPARFLSRRWKPGKTHRMSLAAPHEITSEDPTVDRTLMLVHTDAAT